MAGQESGGQKEETRITERPNNTQTSLILGMFDIVPGQ